MTEEDKNKVSEFCELLRADGTGGQLPAGPAWILEIRARIPHVHNILQRELSEATAPIPMLLWCPECGKRHIDEGAFGGPMRHHTHACQFCGMVWRPSLEHTVGVQYLPGYKNP